MYVIHDYACQILMNLFRLQLGRCRVALVLKTYENKVRAVLAALTDVERAGMMVISQADH